MRGKRLVAEARGRGEVWEGIHRAVGKAVGPIPSALGMVGLSCLGNI